LRDSLRRIGEFKCDILITPHPGASNFIERLDGKAALIDPGACRSYAKRGREALDERLAKEKAP
jgi:metallo-beta-lactamase class B